MVRSAIMRRVALVLVVVLLLLLVLVVPVGMGVAMEGMPCPDCLLSSGTAAVCFAVLFGLAVIVSIGSARQRVASTLAMCASEGAIRTLERPPK
jgi:hypothetical protein